MSILAWRKYSGALPGFIPWGSCACLDAGQTLKSATPPPTGIDARLFLIVERGVKCIEGGTYGLDRLLHGIDTFRRRTSPPLAHVNSNVRSRETFSCD